MIQLYIKSYDIYSVKLFKLVSNGKIKILIWFNQLPNRITRKPNNPKPIKPNLIWFGYRLVFKNLKNRLIQTDLTDRITPLMKTLKIRREREREKQSCSERGGLQNQESLDFQWLGRYLK